MGVLFTTEKTNKAAECRGLNKNAYDKLKSWSRPSFFIPKCAPVNQIIEVDAKVGRNWAELSNKIRCLKYNFASCAQKAVEFKNWLCKMWLQVLYILNIIIINLVLKHTFLKFILKFYNFLFYFNIFLNAFFFLHF